MIDLPHNLDAERAVIGSMLLSAEARAAVSQELKASDFHASAHALTFDVIVALDSSGTPVDVLTVKSALEARGQLAIVGGALALQEMAADVTTPASAEHYAALVADAAMRRRIQQAGQRIAELAANGGEGLREQAEALIYEATDTRRTTEVAGMEQVLTEVMTDLERGTQIGGITTGLHSLDTTLLGGLKPGQLITIGARPGVGKTSLVINFAQAAAEAGYRVLVASAEMSRREIVQRMLAGESRVPGHRFISGLNMQDERAVSDASNRLASLPIDIIDAASISVSTIRTQARRLHPDLIIVDYLQILDIPERETRTGDISKTTRALKVLAKDVSAAVVMCSQLNRESVNGNRAPRLTDLRESGSIEQDSDIVLLLHVAEDAQHLDPRAATCFIAKHRAGATRSIPLSFKASATRFVEAPA